MDNLILASLPFTERTRLDPFLEPVTLSAGEVLVKSDALISHMYFFKDAIGTVLQITRDGSRIPSGLAGYEGIAGFELWLRHSVSPLTAIAHVSGEAVRMRAEDFNVQVLGTSSPLNELLADYVFGYITLASQISVCNRLHSLEERLCRWLRMISVRLPEKKRFHLREAFLADLLFTERSTASITARVLKSAGLIEYDDEHVQILDEHGLEEGACECYPIFHAHFIRMHKQIV